MMAVVQGLTHFVTICMADTMRRMGTDIRATEAYMSPVYQIELGLVGRLLSQDPGLYADILEQNPYVPEVIAACRSAAGDLAAIVKSGDPDAFAEFFRQDSPAPRRVLQTRAGPDRCPDRVHGEEMTVITLGPEGTFSHELAQKLACDPLVLKPTIHGIFAAVAAGEGDGIVPIENSEAGAVGETMDGLSRYPLAITAEMYMPIHHNLASLVPPDKIRVIYAHPQTHEQCSSFIERLAVPVIHTSSNAQSALEAKKTPNAGAILPLSAAAIYKLPVIERNVENNPENTTRFVKISKTPAPTAGPANAASSSTRTPIGPGCSTISSASLPGGGST